MTRNDPVLIVGAGIGGLSAAIALRGAGLPVEVFERAPEVRAIGAGISLWMNAMLALRSLGVESEVRTVSAPFTRTEIQSAKGSVLRRLSISRVAGELGAQPVGIGRPQLIQVLHQACRNITIHTNSRAVSYEQNDGCVILHLGDGRKIRGSVLIGADGVHSAIRTQLAGGCEPAFGGAIEWRGISQSNHGAEAERDCLFSVFGPGHSGGVGWYVDHKRVSWSIGTESSTPGDFKNCGPQTSRLRNLIKNWRSPLRHLVENTPENRVHLSDYFHPVPVKKWGEGRVTLLGDSAHAMSTVFGQGGAQTIEDAVVLAQSLRQARDTVEGLRIYERCRMERVRFITETVENTITLLGMRFRGAPTRWIRSLAVRFVPSAVVTSRISRMMAFPANGSPLPTECLDYR